MAESTTRRQFLARLGAATAVAAATLPARRLLANPTSKPASSGRRVLPPPRVVIARDAALARGRVAEHRELLGKLLDASVQRLTGAPDPGAAWRRLFAPHQRVGIKVNTLGLSTQPAVADAIVAGLRQAGVPDERILVWDRFDVELERAGFRLNRSRRGVQCRGTDAEQIGSGYQSEIQISGRIGSCYSRIVAEQVDVLISVPVLKDHNLAGASLGMKNFYGAIHNPNKYHDEHCDPFVADVVSHRFIAPKWRLTVCDATRAQYNAGPAAQPDYAWPFGGLIVGADFVAADAVGAELLAAERQARGLPSFAEEKRPARYIATAAARGLGEADLGRIERIEL